MFKPVDTRAGRKRRHRRIRVSVSGTPARPRLNVFRSLQHIYAQVIDDSTGNTIAAASTNEPTLRTAEGGGEGSANKTDRARTVGRMVADRAKARGVSAVVFDRGGYLYHGRVRALADGAREAGLDF